MPIRSATCSVRPKASSSKSGAYAHGPALWREPRAVPAPEAGSGGAACLCTTRSGAFSVPYFTGNHGVEADDFTDRQRQRRSATNSLVAHCSACRIRNRSSSGCPQVNASTAWVATAVSRCDANPSRLELFGSNIEGSLNEPLKARMAARRRIESAAMIGHPNSCDRA